MYTHRVTSHQRTKALTGAKLEAHFGSIIKLFLATAQLPAIATAINIHHYDMSAPMHNATTPLVNALRRNPNLSGITIIAYPNSSGEVPIGTPLYMNVTGTAVAHQPCSLFGLNTPNYCFLRTFLDFKGGISTHAKILNSNGDDISQPFLLFPVTVLPEFDDFYRSTLKPNFAVRYLSGLLKKWSLVFAYHHIPDPDNMLTSTLCKAHVTVDTLAPLLQEMKPTPNSILFVVDDLGYLFISTENGTVASAVNATLRQTAPGNVNPVISAAGTALMSRYGSVNGLPNDTALESIMVGSDAWLMGTRSVLMPASGQIFQLILMVPRADYFGKMDGAALKSVIIASATVALGICITIIVGYHSTRSLRKLEDNMRQ
ncbi:hypothetical protein HK101_010622, partial [Irineochytrium annulatum]